MFSKQLLIRAVSAAGLATLLSGAMIASAQDEGHVLMPIGGGYPDTFPAFVEQVIAHAQTLDTDRVYVLMMPMSFTYDVEVLTTTDLLDNSLAIERRRRQLERECDAQVADAGIDYECQVVVPPIYTREAAEDELALDYFVEDLAGVYFVGGDQTFAMQILNGTPVEEALFDAFHTSVPMAGNSAGAAIQSYTMIGGYSSEDFGFEDQLREGIVDLWNSEDRRGLPFGIQSAIIEQHYFQYSRPGRLMNAIVQEGVPHIGIGVDGFTGVIIRDETSVSDSFGLYINGVLDAETFGAHETVTYVDGIMSAHNVLFHTLAPGESSYNIETRTHSLAPLPESLDRDFTSLSTSEEAGRLELNGGSDAIIPMIADIRILIVITGYADAEAAQVVADQYFRMGEVRIVLEGDELGEVDTAGGRAFVIHAGDASLIDAEQLAPIADAWRGGAPLTLNDAAVGLAGAYYAAHPAIDYDNDDDAVIEALEQGVLIDGGMNLVEGWGLVPAIIEPRLIDNTRWGRLVAGLYAHPDLLGVGIPFDGSVSIASDGAFVGGNNGVIVLDFRGATLALGDNGGYVVANGLMDSFAPTEMIIAQAPAQS
jgi:cyanophycinase